MTRAAGTDLLPRRPGRPRSEHTTQAVLGAARKLLLDEGYTRLSIERVAATAGVSKTAIYRRWGSKAVLVGAALADPEPLAAPDTGDVAADLRAILVAGWTGPGLAYRTMTMRVLAEAHGDRELAAAIRSQAVRPRRDLLKDALRRGISRGQVRGDIDLDVAVDVFVGPLLKRMLIDVSPTPASLPGAVVDLILSGIAPRP